MSKPKQPISAEQPDALFGREIVQELQGGEERADYGRQVVEDLSKRLLERYEKGFSIANIKNFRQFYLAYSHRFEKSYPSGSQLPEVPKSYPAGSESAKGHPVGDEFVIGEILSVAGTDFMQGLLLCSDKSEAVAKYSILSENKQIFASKYLPNLPTEEQLRLEIERERQLIESTLEDRSSE